VLRLMGRRSECHVQTLGGRLTFCLAPFSWSAALLRSRAWGFAPHPTRALPWTRQGPCAPGPRFRLLLSLPCYSPFCDAFSLRGTGRPQDALPPYAEILIFRSTPACWVFFSTVAEIISTSASFTGPGLEKSGRYFSITEDPLRLIPWNPSLASNFTA